MATRFLLAGSIMYSTVQIRHFKCFSSVELTHLRRVNVIVGDNGVGKTALMEAIFLAISGSTEIAFRFKQIRGAEVGTAGSRSVIEDAFVGDLWYKSDFSKAVDVKLLGGDSKARFLRVTHSAVSPKPTQSPVGIAVVPPRITFSWTNDKRETYNVGFVANGNNVQLLSTGEDLPTSRYFPASGHTSASEAAALFSDLSRKRQIEPFIDIFRTEFDWIEDLSLQVIAGATSIHATLRGLPETIPVTQVSGAVNRMMSIFLGLSVQNSVVLVDEIDTGIFYKRHVSFCKIIIRLCEHFKTQAFISTHSGEWLEALVEASSGHEENISLIRLERGDAQPQVKQFSGSTFMTGVQMGGEVR